MIMAYRKTPLKQWIIFVLRRILCVLLFFIVIFVRPTTALPYSDQFTLIGKLKMDSSMRSSSSSSSAGVTITSHDLSNTDEDDDDDDDDDDDSDENDDEDDDERVRNAIVGAVPLLLGILAIVILCLFMLCRKSKPSHRIKWIFRNQQQVNRSDRNLTTHAEVFSSDTEEWIHINRNPRQPTTAVQHHHNQSISAYQLRPNEAPFSPPPPQPSSPSLAFSNMDDPPPSYEEVIRGIYDCRPIPVPFRQGITTT